MFSVVVYVMPSARRMIVGVLDTKLLILDVYIISYLGHYKFWFLIGWKVALNRL